MTMTLQKDTCGARETAAITASTETDTGHLPCGSYSGPHWYVVLTHHQAEDWARQNLARQGYEAYLPMVEVEKADRVLPTIRRVVSVPLWPDYLLVRFDRHRDPWRPVAHTQGVKRILGETPLNPTPIADSVYEALVAASDERRFVRRVPSCIQVGTELQISEGAFASFTGLCLWSDEKRVKLLVEIFGRASEVMLPRASVRA